jgi:uncharacterized membrane protein SpoIIM required for sporulation
MDYGRFQQLRRPVWEALERRLLQLGDLAARRRMPGRLSPLPRPGAFGAQEAMSYADLEDLAFTYRQVLHDHALASHRFTGTGAARRLAALALEATRRLTRQSSRQGGLRHFATRSFPAAFRRQLGMLGLAAMVFGAGTAIGLTLSAVQPALGAALLGERAMAGLEEGRLWTASMSAAPPALTSSAIATNNLSVALGAWAGGILAGALPLYMLTLNGLLLGGVVGVTLRYSMAGELLTFVAAHGPLEITLILVAAAAGLSIGRALVTAGDRPRGEALRLAAADSLLVMGGCLPWFVVLGTIEAWISPNPAVSVTFKVALGACLELLFLAAALAPRGRPEDADAARL